MPNPLVPTLIAAGAGLAGTAITAGAQGKLNKKTMQYNFMMNQKARQEALSDYHMQNQYNSPQAMMQRLKDAGLNPNLVYGNGQAVESSAPTRAAQAESWNPKAPEYNFGQVADQSIQAYYNSQVQQAQIDNLTTQNQVLQQEALLKSAQILNTTATTESTKFDTSLKQELKETSVEAAKANLNKTLTDTRYTLDENERKAAMQKPNLEIAAETILNMRMQRSKSKTEIDHIKQQIINLKKDERIKQLDIELKEKGIQPGDAIYWRVLARLLNAPGADLYRELPDHLKSGGRGKQALKGIMQGFK